jgi:hypothetical protein
MIKLCFFLACLVIIKTGNFNRDCRCVKAVKKSRRREARNATKSTRSGDRKKKKQS